MNAIRQWSLRRKLVVAIVGLFILFMPILVFVYPRIREVRTAFHGFSDQLMARNYHKAYEMTSADFQAATNEPTFIAQQMLLTSHHGSLKDVSIWSTQVEYTAFDATATLSAHFKYEHSNEHFAVVMKRYDGQWRLYGYKEE